jgi:hypothetical protein
LSPGQHVVDRGRLDAVNGVELPRNVGATQLLDELRDGPRIEFAAGDPQRFGSLITGPKDVIGNRNGGLHRLKHNPSHTR